MGAQLAQGYDVRFELSSCQFGTNFSHPRGRYLIDEVYRIVMSVGLKQRTILLSVDAIDGRFDIINGPSFDQLIIGDLHVVADFCVTCAVQAKELIGEDGTLEPVAVIQLDSAGVGDVVGWRLYVP